MLGCAWPVFSGEWRPTHLRWLKGAMQFYFLFLSLGTVFWSHWWPGQFQEAHDRAMTHFVCRMTSCPLTGANGITILVWHWFRWWTRHYSHNSSSIMPITGINFSTKHHHGDENLMAKSTLAHVIVYFSPLINLHVPRVCAFIKKLYLPPPIVHVLSLYVGWTHQTRAIPIIFTPNIISSCLFSKHNAQRCIYISFFSCIWYNFMQLYCIFRFL